MISDKSKTNRKWTSSENYRSNYDAIFIREEDVGYVDERCPGCAMIGIYYLEGVLEWCASMGINRNKKSECLWSESCK